MDIDSSNLLELTFEIEAFDDAAYDLIVNNHTVSSSQITVDLNSPIVMKITKNNKGMVNIKSIKANSYEIMPYYMLHSSLQSNRIETTTSWELAITPNFFTWLHNVSGDGLIA